MTVIIRNLNSYIFDKINFRNKATKKTRRKKSTEPDNTYNKILKNARSRLSDIIAHLFNMSIQHSFKVELMENGKCHSNSERHNGYINHVIEDWEKVRD
jgi:hypothetical protein